jgi:hypothetical protein
MTQNCSKLHAFVYPFGGRTARQRTKRAVKRRAFAESLRREPCDGQRAQLAEIAKQPKHLELKTEVNSSRNQKMAKHSQAESHGRDERRTDGEFDR